MVAPVPITPADHARLAREIRAAEEKTCAEIYLVLAHSADEFRLVPVLWASAVALLLPWLLWFATSLDLGTILSLQVLAFVVVSAILSAPALRYRVVPPGISHHAAHRAALAQFLAHGVHLDDDRTAILIYLSMAPRHIEVLADHAIHSKLDERHWRELVELIRSEAQSGRLADGLAAAIQKCGEILAGEFPSNGTHHHTRADIVET